MYNQLLIIQYTWSKHWLLELMADLQPLTVDATCWVLISTGSEAYKTHMWTRLEEIKHLKPPPITMLPSGEHNTVSVYALSTNGRKSGIIQNPQKKIQSATQMSNPAKNFIKIRL